VVGVSIAELWTNCFVGPRPRASRLNRSFEVPGQIDPKRAPHPPTRFTSAGTREVFGAAVLRTIPDTEALVRVVKARSTEARPAEARPAEVRPAEVRPAEVRLAEVRLAEVRPADVRLCQVRNNRGLFRPPSVPDADALLEEFEVLWVGH
jgi:hypothetical protein